MVPLILGVLVVAIIIVGVFLLRGGQDDIVLMQREIPFGGIDLDIKVFIFQERKSSEFLLGLAEKKLRDVGVCIFHLSGLQSGQ